MVVHKHGCAGCASSGDAGLVLLALALVIRRRSTTRSPD